MLALFWCLNNSEYNVWVQKEIELKEFLFGQDFWLFMRSSWRYINNINSQYWSKYSGITTTNMWLPCYSSRTAWKYRGTNIFSSRDYTVWVSSLFAHMLNLFTSAVQEDTTSISCLIDRIPTLQIQFSENLSGRFMFADWKDKFRYLPPASAETTGDIDSARASECGLLQRGFQVWIECSPKEYFEAWKSDVQ